MKGRGLAGGIVSLRTEKPTCVRLVAYAVSSASEAAGVFRSLIGIPVLDALCARLAEMRGWSPHRHKPRNPHDGPRDATAEVLLIPFIHDFWDLTSQERVVTTPNSAVGGCLRPLFFQESLASPSLAAI